MLKGLSLKVAEKTKFVLRDIRKHSSTLRTSRSRAAGPQGHSRHPKPGLRPSPDSQPGELC